MGEIKELVPKEGEVIKKEAARLNDADSIARLPGKLQVRSHSTMRLSLKEILLKLYVHDVACVCAAEAVDASLSLCREGLSSQCLPENFLYLEES